MGKMRVPVAVRVHRLLVTVSADGGSDVHFDAKLWQHRNAIFKLSLRDDRNVLHDLDAIRSHLGTQANTGFDAEDSLQGVGQIDLSCLIDRNRRSHGTDIATPCLESQAGCHHPGKAEAAGKALETRCERPAATARAFAGKAVSSRGIAGKRVGGKAEGGLVAEGGRLRGGLPVRRFPPAQ